MSASFTGSMRCVCYVSTKLRVEGAEGLTGEEALAVSGFPGAGLKNRRVCPLEVGADEQQVRGVASCRPAPKTFGLSRTGFFLQLPSVTARSAIAVMFPREPMVYPLQGEQPLVRRISLMPCPSRVMGDPVQPVQLLFQFVYKRHLILS